MTTKRPVKSTDLLSFKLPGEPRISPVGDMIVYTLGWTNQEHNKYQSALYSVKPGSEPARLTNGDSDSRPEFSPDGKIIAFLSRRSGSSQVWLLPVEGGEAQQLTKIKGGVSQFSWLPGGSQLAIVANLTPDGIEPEDKPDDDKDPYVKHNKDVKVITELFYKLDGVGYFTERRPQLCVVDVETGGQAKARQLTFGPYRVGSLAGVSPDGQHILFTSMRGEGYDREAWQQHLWSVPVAGGEPKQIVGGKLSAQAASFRPDGKQIAFTASIPEEMGYDNVKLYVVDAEGGEPKAIAADYDRTFSNLGLTDIAPAGNLPLTWSKDGGSIFTPSSINGTVQLVKVDVASGKVEQLTNGDRVISTYSLDKAQEKAVLGMADYLNPADVFLFNLCTGAEQRLTEANKELLAELELSTPVRYSFRAENGPEVDGWVMQPINFDPSKQYPAVLEVHGGPMMMYSCSFFFEFQLMASQGYAVIFTNPRGSQGYGEDFCKAIQYEWGNLDYADILAGLDAALDNNPWIDPERVAIGGGSYGGYMTAWAIGHTNRFKAAICGRPVIYWSAEVGTTDGGWLWMRRAKGVKPWVDDSWYRQQSPWTYVENMQTPVLIEVQEGDLRCPIEQGQMLYTALKFLDKAPVRFVRYPNEFHGMSRNGQPWHRVHRLNEIADWLQQYL